MSGAQEQSQGGPTRCEAGCGFYANVGTGGLCSKCFRSQEAEMKQTQAAEKAVVDALCPPPSLAKPAPVAAAAAAVPEQGTSSGIPELSPAVQAATSALAAVVPPSAPTPPKPSTTRCLTCNKKVGLTGFQCKCCPDAVFCSQHRYAEAHACTYDYKGQHSARLAEANPVVQASKLQKF